MHDVYVVMLYYKLYLHTGATAHTCVHATIHRPCQLGKTSLQEGSDVNSWFWFRPQAFRIKFNKW